MNEKVPHRVWALAPLIIDVLLSIYKKHNRVINTCKTVVFEATRLWANIQCFYVLNCFASFFYSQTRRDTLRDWKVMKTEFTVDKVTTTFTMGVVPDTFFFTVINNMKLVYKSYTLLRKSVFSFLTIGISIFFQLLLDFIEYYFILQFW